MTALGLACSASSENKPGGGTGGGTAAGGTPGFGGSGNLSGIGGGITGGGIGIDSSTPDADPDAPCSTYSEKANRPAVDIVFIIDNSGSMTDEIEKVRANINDNFVPIIDQSIIDWQVIMISKKGTDSLAVCVDPPLAGANCADNPPTFHHLNCTVGSNDALTILRNSYAQPGGACVGGTKGWSQRSRFDATKVFVVVTDDEAGDPFGFLFINADKFDNWALTQAQPPGVFGTAQARKYVFHGVIGMDPNDPKKTCVSADNKAEAPGLQYQKLATLTGGIVRSICEDDWSDIFNTIAAGIVNKLSCEYAVPPPDGGTIDPDKVNVTFTPSGGGAAEDVLQDNNFGCDEGADGWQWDPSKTKVLLCGETCNRVKADDNGQIDLVFGCATKVAPPPT
jgi:hypothetical protein